MLLLTLATGLALCVGPVLAGDAVSEEEGSQKVTEGSKLVKEGAKQVVEGAASEAEQGITGFFKWLPWYASPVALMLGLFVGFVLAKTIKGKKPGGDKKK
jgi:hypothetical protein